jgi:hypothetical protein
MTNPDVSKSLTRSGTFHFTPTSASWLNAVEGYFAKLTKQRLKRGVFRSIVELQAAIKRFLAETNADPRPFRWTKCPDKIIAAVKRGHQVLDSIHSHVRHFKMQARILLACLPSRSAWPPLGKAGGTIMKTTVDHALMRGLVTAGPVMRRGASSV